MGRRPCSRPTVLWLPPLPITPSPAGQGGREHADVYGEGPMNLLYAVFIDPFVQMGAAPDLLVQTLWEGLGRRRALRADRARLRADLQGLGRVQLRAGHHGGVRRADAGRRLRHARRGRAGGRARRLPGARRGGRRDADPGVRGRAADAAAAGEPARHHPVHGDVRADLFPHRPRRTRVRRQSQGDDRRRALLPKGAIRHQDARRLRVSMQKIDIAAVAIASVMVVGARASSSRRPASAARCARSPTATRRRCRSASRSSRSG